MDELAIIGRAENVCFTSDPKRTIPAKIDTGADLSSVWASEIEETTNGLSFYFFGEGNQYFDGVRVTLPKGEYRKTIVANSFGVKERRYVVLLELVVLGKTLKADFTLANRSTKIYPILLGRKLLAHHFLVDVTKGEPLVDLERKQAAELKVEIDEREQ